MKRLLLFLATSALVAAPIGALAGSECYVDPVHEYAWTGKIVSAVFMRDNACVSGTNILLTLSAGASVNVVGETDGWYYVESNGSRGWVGAQFIQILTQASTGKTWDSYQDFMEAYPAKKAATTAPPPTTGTSSDLVNRLKGYILLDVQSHGEAWYLNPTNGYRYYMKDGATAYEMMRSFGLGMTEADYARLDAGDTTLRNRLKGRIMLRVQAHGEAYYIHPKTLAVHYLKDGPSAYEVMRFYSLGITSADLSRIPAKEVPVLAY